MRIPKILACATIVASSGCYSTSCEFADMASTAITNTSAFYLPLQIDSVRIISTYDANGNAPLLTISEDSSLFDSCRVIATGNSVSPGDTLKYHDTATVIGRTLTVQIGDSRNYSRPSTGKGDAAQCSPTVGRIETSSVKFVKPVNRKLVVSIW